MAGGEKQDPGLAGGPWEPLDADLEGILTGMRIFACLILLTVNKKKLEPSFHVYGVNLTHLGIFQCLAFSLKLL